MGDDSALNRLHELTGWNETMSGSSQQIDLYTQAISQVEQMMWSGQVTEWLELYQQLYQEKEALIKAQGSDERYPICIVIPVADRPQHLKTCLQSLQELCAAFHYGGVENHRYEKISVIIADDSMHETSMQQHRKLACEYSERGLDTEYFGISEQLKQLQMLDIESMAGILGTTDRACFYHKGPSVMRNIVYLKLNAQKKKNQLYYFVDSDQEFRVKIQSASGEQDVCAINYFAELERIFSQQKVSILTGKVVGDPPVSPAVMAGNFLQDVIAFVHEISDKPVSAACEYHAAKQQKKAEAAYHDMAALFGFEASQDAYEYRCDLMGEHNHADCFTRFSNKLNQFFYGEHPTRKSFYAYTGEGADVQPARTIYTGNYVFNASGLKYFIPFAALRLRMAGPVLGRVIKAEIGEEFVSANLPMLHKRTVEQTGKSEFRPGVSQRDKEVDLSDEFERQYYGDVMLFAMEQLIPSGYPESLSDKQHIREVVASTEQNIQQQYADKHAEIMRKLVLLKLLFRASDNWWNQREDLELAKQSIEQFIHNIELNYSPSSQAHSLMNSADKKSKRLTEIVQAIHAYPMNRKLWESVSQGSA